MKAISDLTSNDMVQVKTQAEYDRICKLFSEVARPCMMEGFNANRDLFGIGFCSDKKEIFVDGWTTPNTTLTLHSSTDF